MRRCLSLVEQDVVGVEPAFDRAGVEAVGRVDDKGVHLLFAQHGIKRVGQLDFAANTIGATIALAIGILWARCHAKE